MRKIIKAASPSILTHYRKQSHASYSGLPSDVKATVKMALLTEQGHLCAYCMQRIKTTNMKLEHWPCQQRYADQQLEYSNMLGCCTGNEGQPKSQQTCDTLKANNNLKFSPAISAHAIESKIRYLGDGRIDSKEPEFNSQLNNVLNLNHPRLIANRKAVLLGIQEVLGKSKGSRSQAELAKLMAQNATPNAAGELIEYLGVVIDDLQKRHRRAG